MKSLQRFHGPSNAYYQVSNGTSNIDVQVQQPQKMTEQLADKIQTGVLDQVLTQLRGVLAVGENEAFDSRIVVQRPGTYLSVENGKLTSTQKDQHVIHIRAGSKFESYSFDSDSLTVATTRRALNRSLRAFIEDDSEDVESGTESLLTEDIFVTT